MMIYLPPQGSPPTHTAAPPPLFTPSGETLISVGADDDHLLVLWDWRAGLAKCHVLTHRERLYGLRSAPWSPPPRPTNALVEYRGEEDEDAWVLAVGKGFARVYRTNELPGRHGIKLALPGRERAAALLSIGFSKEGTAVLGSATGAIHAFDLLSGKLLFSVKDAHAGPVHVLTEGPSGIMLSCGKDGAVRFWTEDLTPVDSHPLLDAVATGLALLSPGNSLDRVNPMVVGLD